MEAAIKTAFYNCEVNRPAQEIMSGGRFYYPPGYKSKGGFDGIAARIWVLQQTYPDMEFDDRPFEALIKIIAFCKEKNIELALVPTPNHVYDDYFIGAIDIWGKVQAWLERTVHMAPVVSFTQRGRKPMRRSRSR